MRIEETACHRTGGVATASTTHRKILTQNNSIRSDSDHWRCDEQHHGDGHHNRFSGHDLPQLFQFTNKCIFFLRNRLVYNIQYRHNVTIDAQVCNGKSAQLQSAFPPAIINTGKAPLQPLSSRLGSEDDGKSVPAAVNVPEMLRLSVATNSTVQVISPLPLAV